MTSPQFPLSLAGSRFAKEMKMGGILFITPSNNAFANLRSSPLTPRRCEKIPFSPPPCPSPVKGEEIYY